MGSFTRQVHGSVRCPQRRCSGRHQLDTPVSSKCVQSPPVVPHTYTQHTHRDQRDETRIADTEPDFCCGRRVVWYAGGVAVREHVVWADVTERETCAHKGAMEATAGVHAH